jgi:enamidase
VSPDNCCRQSTRVARQDWREPAAPRRAALVNLGGIVTGRLGEPRRAIETLLIVDGRIAELGGRTNDAELVVDARGALACPGLIDTHVHVVFGDWTPRQSALGWLESYVHGGVTTVMSASEVHLPGRPTDPAGVKALAITAQRAFSRLRPGGMKVHAGSLIIEPGLREEDFDELTREGVRLAKVGFGAWESQALAAPLVRAAQARGFVVMAHTGGASLPDSSSVTIDDLIALDPDIAGHANGGTTALPEADWPRLFDELNGFIQLVQAGNLRSALGILRHALERDALGRIVIATDTPTGTGLMPLGMLKSIAELSSLGGLAAADAIALATGNASRALRVEEGVVAEGAPADIVLLQAPLGGSRGDALQSIENGDLPSITAVLIDGALRALRSRNTPAPVREAAVVRAPAGGLA